MTDPAFLAYRKQLEISVACAWSELHRLHPELKPPFQRAETIALWLTGIARRQMPTTADGAYRMDQ